MNTNDSSTTTPAGPSGSGNGKETGSSSAHSPAHTELDQSSSTGSSGASSSLSSRTSRRSPRSQDRPNEATPIFNGAGASTRNYQTTEAQDVPFGRKGRTQEDQSNQVTSNGATDTDTTPQNQQAIQAELHTKQRSSWVPHFVDKYGSLELENKGSVARDHLALERTFLAWMRTSLAFASIGIAVTQLFRLNVTVPTTKSNFGHSQIGPPSILPPNDPNTLLDILTSNPAQDSSRLRSVGKPLGSTFIGVAIVILIIGFHRYFESQYWIVRGKFPASRGSVAITAFVALALIVAALVVILAVSPNAIEG